MLTVSKEELERLVGTTVIAVTAKGEFEGEVEGIAHNDTDSYLVIGEYRVGCKAIEELVIVLTEEEAEQQIETPTDEEFDSIFDMHVQAVFQNYRYAELADPDATLEQAIAQVSVVSKFTPEQSERLAEAVLAVAKAMKDPEESEISADVREALEAAEAEEALARAAEEAPTPEEARVGETEDVEEPTVEVEEPEDETVFFEDEDEEDDEEVEDVDPNKTTTTTPAKTPKSPRVPRRKKNAPEDVED